MTLGQRIQEGRLRLGLSQEGLGERLGVSRQAVSRWEADGAVPDTDKLIALGRLFGVSLNALLQVEEPARLPAADPAKGGRKRLWHTLSALFAAALVASNVLLWLRVGRLEQAPTAVPDPAVPQAADFDFGITADGDGVHLQCNLTAARVTEDMAVTFSAVARDGTWETVDAEHVAQGNYIARLTLPGLPEAPILLSAAFADGTEAYVQPLVRVTEYGAAHSSWVPLWEE